MVMLLIMIIGGAYLLVSQLNRGNGRSEADRKTSEALAKAKETLIGWAVANLTTPGMLPYPDRRDDGQYDGLSDCPAAGVPTSAILLLGKIPQVGPAIPCIAPRTTIGIDVVDGAGEVLWYAVSRNMVSALGGAPVINPDIINNPPFPWLVVRDQNGNIINNRVAFVLIAPGPPLPGQDRTVPPPPALPPTAAQFLEGIGVVSNADFNGAYDTGAPCLPATPPTPMCEDFVMSEPWPLVTALTFNDRLLYVTIDELMPLIEKRVAGEVRQRLLEYFVAHQNFPYTANLTGGGACFSPNRRGRVPTSGCSAVFPITLFPGWFGAPNNWQNYIYYTVAPACVEGTTNCNGVPNTFLTVGNITNVRAVVITAGRTLNGVTCNTSSPPPYNQAIARSTVCDYLDSAENTNLDDVYAGVGQPITNIFNDQAIIVAP